MSLNADSAPQPKTPSTPKVSVTVLVVAVIITAGVAVGVTGAFFVLTKSGPPGSVRITDDLGRSVNVPYDPSRVVVLGPSIMDSMYRLGLRSHVVGVDCYAAVDGGITDDYSSDQIALWNLSQSMCVEVAPQFEYEALLNFSAQLVLAATIIGAPEVQEIQTDYHIPVVMLQPPTLSGVQVDLSLLAQIFGVQSQANALGAQLSSELYNATTIDVNLTSFPTVLVTYTVDSNGYWTFGPTTFGQSLIEIAGGTSIGANATLAYPELSPEQVLNADPQFIVYGTGFGLNLSYYETAPLWSSLPAVQHGNISGINSNWITEADPTMILEGLPALLAIFHPGSP
jgi:iron complex transport system substrate-binding protein